MPDHDRLSSLVLMHWSRYHPSMLERLRGQNLLETALSDTAEQMSDRLYELVSVRGMEYNQAWELVIHEFLLPEESSPTSSPNPQPPPVAISG